MRYLGSKDALCGEILELLSRKNISTDGLTLFDAFCGTGAVSNSLKSRYNIILNDSLISSAYYAKGRIIASSISFKNLGFDPFDYLNSKKDVEEGFFYHNYSPGGSNRMYFTEANAGRIDFFRNTIEDWYQKSFLSQDEYIYLLACLIESVSKVSNTAGVYGAFLKHWDPRAHLPITILPFEKGEMYNSDVKCYNRRIEDIIAEVDCDILYLDPPYTQNQYGTQYHLLETLVLNDNPTISRVTGSRPVTPMRSDWSKDVHAHILFEKIIAKTTAKHIVFSYNNDGFMSKDFIEATLKRFGKEETYECREIQYKKYNNTKCKGKEGHFEYLFYIEKKDVVCQVIESPLNYSGNKAKMMGQIKSLLPENICSFVDLFGGGLNVGINIECNDIIYNELNSFVVGLITSFKQIETYSYIKYIQKLIKDYALQPVNPDGYYKLREKYNSLPFSRRDPRMLYVLILFGFQQQIRFNSDHDFNLPCGQRRFNEKLISKFITFSRVIREKNISLRNEDFRDVLPSLSSDTFIYLDPPYRATTAVYNDGNRGFEGWTEKHELEMCSLLDSFSKRKGRFMLSYVIDVGRFHNNNIDEWAHINGYTIIPVSETQGRHNNRREVLIINY